MQTVPGFAPMTENDEQSGINRNSHSGKSKAKSRILYIVGVHYRVGNVIGINHQYEDWCFWGKDVVAE
jgi:hypothetical protein